MNTHYYPLDLFLFYTMSPINGFGELLLFQGHTSRAFVMRIITTSMFRRCSVFVIPAAGVGWDRGVVCSDSSHSPTVDMNRYQWLTAVRPVPVPEL